MQRGRFFGCLGSRGCVRARLRLAAAGSRRVGGQSCSRESLRLPSTCAPPSPRALKRARYGGAALILPSWASSCLQHGSMALSARACCAGAAAKAPTQRVARRNRRRRWCLGLRRDAHGGGGGGGGDGSHHLCSTPSSCDGVECVFAFPTGEARHRARRCTQVRCRRRLQRRLDEHGGKEASAHCKAMWDGVREEPGEATMAPLSSRAAPRHLVSTRRAPPSSPPRLVRVRNPQRLLPGCLAPMPAPAADPPGSRLRGRRP